MTPAESAAISLLQDAPDESIADLIELVSRTRVRLIDPVSRRFVDSKDVARALRRLKPKPYKNSDRITVFHATDEDAAEVLLLRGFIPETKPRNLGTDYAPGRGLDRGLYVGATPRSVEGYGRVILALTVPRKHLRVPTELAQLGETSPLRALKTHDGALVSRPIPPQAIQRAARRNAGVDADEILAVSKRMFEVDRHLPAIAQNWNHNQASMFRLLGRSVRRSPEKAQRVIAAWRANDTTIDGWLHTPRSWEGETVTGAEVIEMLRDLDPALPPRIHAVMQTIHRLLQARENPRDAYEDLAVYAGHAHDGLEEYYPASARGELKGYRGEKVFWAESGRKKVGFMGPTDGRMVPIDAEYAYPIEGNIFYEDKFSALVEAIRRGQPVVLQPGYARLGIISEDDVQESRDYEDDEIGRAYEDEDVGELGAQVRDGNHRTFAGLVAGIPYTWVLLSENQMQDVLEPADYGPAYRKRMDRLYKAIRAAQRDAGAPLLSRSKARRNPRRTQPYKYGVPAKYLAGLPDKTARARAAEILRRRKQKGGKSRPLPGDAAARKRTKGSKWTRMYKAQYGPNAGTNEKKVARETGIPLSIISQVYKRGIGASRSSGYRPGATPSSWALARVHAFVMKVLHKKGPINQDPDLARKVLARRNGYAWVPLRKVKRLEGEMARRGVSEVARSPRGFLTAYKRGNLTDWWKRRRENFIARHMAQVKNNNEALWVKGKPSRRHLALIAWAYTPTPSKLDAYLRRSR